MSSKRTRSASRPERPHKIAKIWGRCRDDFQPVTIVSVQPNKGHFDASCFTKVSYTEHAEQTVAGNPAGQTIAMIQYFDCCNLADHISPIVDMTTLTKTLQPLKEEQLRSLVVSHKMTWDILESTDLAMTGLCRKVVKGFLHNMANSPGKDSLQCLVSDIVTKLQLSNTLQVIGTGSPSHMTYVSTFVQHKRLNESSSETVTAEESSPQLKPADVIVDTPVTRRQTVVTLENSPLTDTSSDTSYSSKCKVRTADVLVYSQENLCQPIKSKLTISVKKGQVKDDHDIWIELLSRLPYQSGHIFGLDVNATGGRLCSVQCTRKDQVDLVSYHPHSFRYPDRPFDLDSFFALILDIGRILVCSGNTEVV